jgi:CBS domain-containing protein
MTRDLVSVPSGTSMESVAEMMIARGLSRAPVVDSRGRMIGMISKSDLVERADEGDVQILARSPERGLLASERGLHAQGEPLDVDHIMTPAVTSISEQDTVQQAASLMASKHLHGLPVVGEDGQPVGFLSSLDILAWLAGLR